MFGIEAIIGNYSAKPGVLTIVSKILFASGIVLN